VVATISPNRSSLVGLLNVVVTQTAIEIGDGKWRGSTSHFQVPSPRHDALITLAGEVAQQRYHPDPTSLRSWNDYYKCFQLLNGNLSLMEKYKEEVAVILDSHWNKVESVAEALILVESLNSDQISDALRPIHQRSRA